MEITADLFHGLLGSMGQLYNASPNLWGQGFYHFPPVVYRVDRGGYQGWQWGCWATIRAGITFIDMKIPADMFHGLLGAMGQL